MKGKGEKLNVTKPEDSEIRSLKISIPGLTNTIIFLKMNVVCWSFISWHEWFQISSKMSKLHLFLVLSLLTSTFLARPLINTHCISVSWLYFPVCYRYIYSSKQPSTTEQTTTPQPSPAPQPSSSATPECCKNGTKWFLIVTSSLLVLISGVIVLNRMKFRMKI